MEIKFCKDCKHAKFEMAAWFCYHPSVKPDANLVTGQNLPIYCSVERQTGRQCAPAGNLWEAKNGND